MPFPVVFEETSLPTAFALGAEIAARLEDIPAAHAWLEALADAGALSSGELEEVVYALFSRGPREVVLGAKLCASLRLSLVPALVAVLTQHDLGTLLTAVDGEMVEGTVTRAAAGLPLTDPVCRHHILAQLRTLGEGVLEARVLVNDGSDQELKRWVPNLLAFDDPEILAELMKGRDNPVLASLLGLRPA